VTVLIKGFGKVEGDYRVKNSEVSEPGYVSLRSVSKTFGDVHAVVDLDLDIASGEFFSMLGPSGSGKQRCCG